MPGRLGGGGRLSARQGSVPAGLGGEGRAAHDDRQPAVVAQMGRVHRYRSMPAGMVMSMVKAWPVSHMAYTKQNVLYVRVHSNFLLKNSH